MEVSVPRESDPSTSKAPSPYFDIQVWEKMSMMQIPGDGEKNASEGNVAKVVCQPWEIETPYCAVKRPWRHKYRK